MEFIYGISLCGSWFKPISLLVQIEYFCAKVLKDVAAAMIQWNKLTYNQRGSLVLDDDCNVIDIGRAKIFDGPAHYESPFNQNWLD